VSWRDSRRSAPWPTDAPRCRVVVAGVRVGAARHRLLARAAVYVGARVVVDREAVGAAGEETVTTVGIGVFKVVRGSGVGAADDTRRALLVLFVPKYI
jgi:hypothetical protein